MIVIDKQLRFYKTHYYYYYHPLVYPIDNCEIKKKKS